MSWLELTIATSDELAETVGETLDTAGALSVTFGDSADQPLYEPKLGTTPLWQQTRVVGLFAADTDTLGLRTLIAALGIPAAAVDERLLEDREWTRSWMDHFRPMRFGERLWVYPTDHPDPEPKDGLVIRLDPGLAFGSGTHPTTRLCLEWLDAQPPLGERVVDYGCGSGILAVAAARLGAASVVGVDHDPQAVQATRSNAEQNGVAQRIHACRNEEEDELHADCVVANILAGPLQGLASHLAAMLEPGGRMALSGILADQADAVAAAYAQWFHMAAPVEHEGWIRLDGVRK